jgi:hypothetical protein
MAYVKKTPVYLVCDHRSNGILVSSTDSLVANSLCLAASNSYVKMTFVENNQMSIMLVLDSLIRYYKLREGLVIEELMPEEVTEVFLESKKKLLRIKHTMHRWIDLCTITINKQTTALCSETESLMIEELYNCNGVPSQLISELAQIKGVPVDVYISTSTATYNNIKNSKLRLLAVFEKYRDKISTCPEEELQNVFNAGAGELLTYAFV